MQSQAPLVNIVEYLIGHLDVLARDLKMKPAAPQYDELAKWKFDFVEGLLLWIDCNVERIGSGNRGAIDNLRRGPTCSRRGRPKKRL